MDDKAIRYPRREWIYEHFGLEVCYEHCLGGFPCVLPKGHEGKHNDLCSGPWDGSA